MLIPYYSRDELEKYYGLLPNEVAIVYGDRSYLYPAVDREVAYTCGEVRSVHGVINAALFIEKDPAALEWAKGFGFSDDLIREHRVGTSNVLPSKNRMQAYRIAGIWDHRAGYIKPDLTVLPIKCGTDVIATAVLYRDGSWKIPAPGAWVFNLDVARWQPAVELEKDLTRAVRRVSQGEMNVVSTAGEPSPFQRLVLDSTVGSYTVVTDDRISIRS